MEYSSIELNRQVLRNTSTDEAAGDGYTYTKINRVCRTRIQYNNIGQYCSLLGMLSMCSRMQMTRKVVLTKLNRVLAEQSYNLSAIFAAR